MDISSAFSFDPAIHFRGLLCIRGHEWEGSAQSLRYLSTRQCVACLRESCRIDRERPDYRLSDGELTLLLGRLQTRTHVWAHLWAHLSGSHKDECWLWSGRTVHGYGMITLRLAGRTKGIRTHRLAFLLANGYLPAEPLVVRHAVCGDRRCCNPHHLLAGTTQHNVDDRQRHGRTARGPRAHRAWAARGEGHGQARWTDAQIEAMRARRAAGETVTDIATAFGTTRRKVHDIVTGQAWTHVGGPITPARSVAPPRKLTPGSVERLWQMYEEGLGPTPIARALGVTTRTVRSILNGETWARQRGPVPRESASRSTSAIP